jgi:hypothetical protein
MDFFDSVTSSNNGQESEADLSGLNQYPVAHPDAFYGITGRIARIIEPETEADPIAILVQLLIAEGCAIGHGPFFRVGATKHYLNLFSCLVGRTSKGRKGSALDFVTWVMEQVDCPWVGTCVSSGLSSGEGLIYAVRDQLIKTEQIKKGGRNTGEEQENIVDYGVEDKRLLVTEGEFSRALKAMSREANILSEVLRSAWENGYLRSMVKTNPYRATDAHISILGHITGEELQQSLKTCDFFNGFANRFLWLCVQRSRVLPFGGKIENIKAKIKEEIAQLQATINWARDVGEIHRSPAANKYWASIYEELTAEIPGRFGAAIGRAEAQVLRLSMLLALLDQVLIIEEAHIRAAKALWSYCLDSARHLFLNQIDDPHAQKILAALRQTNGTGLTRAEISNEVFQRNLTKNKMQAALTYLRRLDLAHFERYETQGRPGERWFATAKKDFADEEIE